MRGSIKSEEIDGQKYDIKKCGASVAIEAQSIMLELVSSSGVSKDSNTDSTETMVQLMRGMTIDVVKRMKQFIISTIAAPVIDDDSFEDLDPNTVLTLFLMSSDWQTGTADKKKED